MIRFLSLIVGPRMKTKIVKDAWIEKILINKTGLHIPSFTLFHEQIPYGMMAGLPFRPTLIISEKLYKTFNKDEMEWVILHEAAHCLYWHSIIASLIEIFFIFIGWIIIQTNHSSLFISCIIAILFSIFCIQILRNVIEYQADNYAISKVDNPKGVITAQDKLRKSYSKGLFTSEKSILRALFHWNLYPQQRIEIALQRMK